ALDGEAGFAASGTAIAVAGDRHAWIGTGAGPRARVYRTADAGKSWDAVDTPLPAGPTAGIFGVAFRDTLNGVAVGGDYTDTTSAALNVLRTRDGGRSWELA
ncbi:MAG: oxidoreductase, partial [Gemmatimonadetes bacterium]|nr:oxidoreductase [Gemmatimonadota bacterium]NIQ54159.1 oxidoreductase [Gemmatimonadota bacterium]NIU74353.1 oxidoreductase [Gammaproteobacteria bacterium]NIX44360.1 oxidoreductase [Gemmatimonadota bacterium]NIY08581.1 oxidoreductase [Gemmatimonadota bacterium]